MIDKLYVGAISEIRSIVIDYIGHDGEHGPYAALVYLRSFPAKNYEKAHTLISAGILLDGCSVRRLLDEVQSYKDCNCPRAKIYVAPCCLAILQVENQVYTQYRDNNLTVPDCI